MKLRQRAPGRRILSGVVTELPYDLVDDARRVPARRIAHMAVPRPIMPCQPRREMDRHADVLSAAIPSYNLRIEKVPNVLG